MQRASLRFPNFTADFASVEDAIEHWRGLPQEELDHVVLSLEGGAVLQPSEIAGFAKEHFH